MDKIKKIPNLQKALVKEINKILLMSKENYLQFSNKMKNFYPVKYYYKEYSTNCLKCGTIKWGKYELGKN